MPTFNANHYPYASRRSAVFANRGMVATSQPLAAQAGLQVLQAGGNAIDAAIAAAAALTVVEPTANGIGGDAFALIWHKGQLHGLNASGPAPMAISLDALTAAGHKEVPKYGALPVTVPGTPSAWVTMAERFGRMPLSRSMAGAISLAQDGFPISPVVAFAWQQAYKTFSREFKDDHFKSWFDTFGAVDGSGRAPQAGEIWRSAGHASTLQSIADDNARSFYQGALAEKTAAFIRAAGGYMDVSDLANFRPQWVDPISSNYRGYDVWELPPNGQGLAALQMLNILEGYDFSKIPFGSTEHVHLFVEAKKLAFEDRAKFYADPDFSEAPIAGLLSKSYATERRKLISADKAMRSVEPGTPRLDGDTIYMTTADQWGNMVSLIQSNYRGMGSGMSPPGLGFILQDRGEMFVLKEGHANSFAPGKRPFHTIIPAFITKDGAPWASFGVMGGDMQPQGHVEIVMDLIDFGMNLQEAGDAPRIQHEGSTSPEAQAEAMADGGFVDLESGFPYETVRGLMQKGHSVRFASGPYGGYQAIRWDAQNHTYIGASESRKDGQAAGY